MTEREGFIFLSAPGSTTPAHTDPEHNFLLQVRGPKEMNVGAFPDPSDRAARSSSRPLRRRPPQRRLGARATPSQLRPRRPATASTCPRTRRTGS